MAALKEIDHARAVWFAHTADFREKCHRARTELRARGIDPDDPDDQVTADGSTRATPSMPPRTPAARSVVKVNLSRPRGLCAELGPRLRRDGPGARSPPADGRGTPATTMQTTEICSPPVRRPHGRHGGDRSSGFRATFWLTNYPDTMSAADSDHD